MDPSSAAASKATPIRGCAHAARQRAGRCGVDRSDEVYFLEPASRFFGEEAASETLAYRLSDTDSEWIPGSCAATQRAPRRRAKAARAARPTLHEVLGETATAAAAGNLKQADLGMVADFEYFSKHGADAATDIAEIINNVDGIYETEIGVTLRLVTTVVFTTASDPFSASTNPSTLLGELSSWRGATTTAPPEPCGAPTTRT